MERLNIYNKPHYNIIINDIIKLSSRLQCTKDHKESVRIFKLEIKK